MKRSHGLLVISGLAAAIVFAGCSDDTTSNNVGTAGLAGSGVGGSAGASAGTSTVAGTTAVAGSVSTAGSEMGGTAGGGGVGGTTAGTGGTTAGTGGTGGTGGTPPMITPTVFLIDNIRLQLADGVGSMGGAGGAGAAGAPGDAGAPADMAGAGGIGPQDPAPEPPGFLLTFDTALTPFTIHSDGFSPGVSAETAGTPFILQDTTLTWVADVGHPGGAAKMSIPLTVKNQQADFGGTFATPADLTGYELTADVKMSETGDIGTCATVWLYVYGANGYANDKSAEPAAGVTSHLVKGQWTKVRLNLDGPYGLHSTANHPNFKPTDVGFWGAQVNTFGCP